MSQYSFDAKQNNDLNKSLSTIRLKNQCLLNSNPIFFIILMYLRRRNMLFYVCHIYVHCAFAICMLGVNARIFVVDAVSSIWCRLSIALLWQTFLYWSISLLQSSVTELMKNLSSKNPNYIRCIKVRFRRKMSQHSCLRWVRLTKNIIWSRTEECSKTSGGGIQNVICMCVVIKECYMIHYSMN